MLTPSLSHLKSKMSAWEQDLADLPWVIKDIKASIPASTHAFLPRKNDFNAGLIFSDIFKYFFQFHSKPPDLIYLNKASTVYDSYRVNVKVCGMNLELWQLFLLSHGFLLQHQS